MPKLKPDVEPVGKAAAAGVVIDAELEAAGVKPLKLSPLLVLAGLAKLDPKLNPPNPALAAAGAGAMLAPPKLNPELGVLPAVLVLVFKPPKLNPVLVVVAVAAAAG